MTKDRNKSVETFPDELKQRIREGLPAVEEDALVKRARELAEQTDVDADG